MALIDGEWTTAPFLRATGVAGIVAGTFTLGIIALPWIHGSPTSFDERIALHANPLYLLGQWLSFLNIFAIVLAGWGIAAHRMSAHPGAASTGMLFLLFYAAPELLGRAAMVFVREYRWAHALSEGSGEQHLAEYIRVFDSIWSGWFILILIAFTTSALLLGWALRGGSGIQRAASAGLLAAGTLGGVTLIGTQLPALRGPASVAYVVIQPTSRFLMGAFLLSEARIGRTANRS